MGWSVEDLLAEGDRELVRLPPGWRRGGPFSRQCEACSCFLRPTNRGTRCSPCMEAGRRPCFGPEVQDKFRAAAVMGAVHWAWLGRVDSTGVPVVYHNEQVFQARRVSWMLHRGGLKDRLSLEVTCGVKTCTRPDHLAVRFRPSDPTAWVPPSGLPRDKTGKLLAACVQEFESHVERNGAGCHVWRGVVNSKGFPVVVKWGVVLSARRVAFEVGHGHPPRENIFNTCGTRLCMNPAHLLDARSKVKRPPCPECGRTGAAALHKQGASRVRRLLCRCGFEFRVRV